MTTYFGPAVSGFGVDELIGYLNGFNIPNFLDFKTLLTKISCRSCLNCQYETRRRPSTKRIPWLTLDPIWELWSSIFRALASNFSETTTRRGSILPQGLRIGGRSKCGIWGACRRHLVLYEFSKPNTFWTIDIVSKGSVFHILRGHPDSVLVRLDLDFQ